MCAPAVRVMAFIVRPLTRSDGAVTPVPSTATAATVSLPNVAGTSRVRASAPLGRFAVKVRVLSLADQLTLVMPVAALASTNCSQR